MVDVDFDSVDKCFYKIMLYLSITILLDINGRLILIKLVKKLLSKALRDF